MFKQGFVKAVAVVAALVLGLAGVMSSASATVVGTRTVMAQAEHEATVLRVQAALDREAVQSQLMALGVDAEAAKERIASLTPAELRQLDGQLATLPAGAGVLEVIGVVFVVLLILEIVGVTNIFRGV
ncbi:MAG: PA2779 family protein [Gammaproteobacteria bacterium]